MPCVRNSRPRSTHSPPRGADELPPAPSSAARWAHCGDGQRVPCPGDRACSPCRRASYAGPSLGVVGSSSRRTGPPFAPPRLHRAEPRARRDMVALIRAAIDRSVTFFDTAEVYGPFTSDEIIGEALAPVRDHGEIATKFDFAFEGNRTTGRNSRPEQPKRDSATAPACSARTSRRSAARARRSSLARWRPSASASSGATRSRCRS